MPEITPQLPLCQLAGACGKKNRLVAESAVVIWPVLLAQHQIPVQKHGNAEVTFAEFVDVAAEILPRATWYTAVYGHGTQFTAL